MDGGADFFLESWINRPPIEAVHFQSGGLCGLRSPHSEVHRNGRQHVLTWFAEIPSRWATSGSVFFPVPSDMTAEHTVNTGLPVPGPRLHKPLRERDGLSPWIPASGWECPACLFTSTRFRKAGLQSYGDNADGILQRSLTWNESSGGRGEESQPTYFLEQASGLLRSPDVACAYANNMFIYAIINQPFEQMTPQVVTLMWLCEVHHGPLGDWDLQKDKLHSYKSRRDFPIA